MGSMNTLGGALTGNNYRSGSLPVRPFKGLQGIIFGSPMAYHQDPCIFSNRGRITYKFEGMDGTGGDKVIYQEAHKIFPYQYGMKRSTNSTEIPVGLPF
jgi:hypothetical protein